jgi:hypothetical protein
VLIERPYSKYPDPSLVPVLWQILETHKKDPSSYRIVRVLTEWLPDNQLPDLYNWLKKNDPGNLFRMFDSRRNLSNRAALVLQALDEPDPQIRQGMLFRDPGALCTSPEKRRELVERLLKFRASDDLTERRGACQAAACLIAGTTKHKTVAAAACNKLDSAQYALSRGTAPPPETPQERKACDELWNAFDAWWAEQQKQ